MDYTVTGVLLLLLLLLFLQRRNLVYYDAERVTQSLTNSHETRKTLFSALPKPFLLRPPAPPPPPSLELEVGADTGPPGALGRGLLPM
jgi:hypothetical protein